MEKTMKIVGLLLISGMFCVTGWCKSKERPILISSIEGLQAIGKDEKSLAKDYILVADIDFEGWNGIWKPIGERYMSFTGKFDGNNHKISGLYSTQGGVFGAVGTYKTRAKICHLRLENFVIDAAHNLEDCGGLANMVLDADITNISANQVTINANMSNYNTGVGCLIGKFSCGTLSESNVTDGNITVSGATCLEGLVGALRCDVCNARPEVFIEECYTEKCSIKKESLRICGAIVGMVCGVPSAIPEIANCHTKNASISGEVAGGVAGTLCYGIITNCSCREGKFKVNNDYSAGGIAGSACDGIICNSIVEKSKISGGNVGGIVGWSIGKLTIEQCSALNNVIAGGSAGGIGGILYDSEISNSHSSGGSAEASDLPGGYYAGGLVSCLYRSKITNSYATINVKGGWCTGGLVGETKHGASVINSYWNTDEKGGTGQEHSSGSGDEYGMTTDDMQLRTDMLIYENWSDEIWNLKILDEYPTLKWQDGKSDLPLDGENLYL